MNAGYVRLSRDDDKRNYVSIENQKLIIRQYAAERGETIDRWYEDDGVSGYRFDRPGFGQLMADLDRDIDTVYVKDFSRLGRHNAKVLLLLDEFQEREKRLIVIDDHYDSIDPCDDTIGIKTWYNERYVKDTSQKIKRAIGAKQKEGTLVTQPPFGYRRSAKDKNALEIVPGEAESVRLVFELYISGYGYRKIAGYLTGQGIPTPSMILHRRELEQGRLDRRMIAPEWSDGMVKNLLDNDFYTGTLRLKKRTRNTIHGKEKRVPKEEQYVFEDHHPAIIEKATFSLVQELKEKRNRTNYRGSRGQWPGTDIPNPFGSCLFCKDCKNRLTSIKRKTSHAERKYYICTTYNTKGRCFCSKAHLIEENALMADILNYLKLCRNALQDAIAAYDVTAFQADAKSSEENRQKLQAALEEKRARLKILLAQKIQDLSLCAQNQDLIQETYEALQNDLFSQIHDLEKQIEKPAPLRSKAPEAGSRLPNALEALDRFLAKGTLDRRDVELFIERIDVDEHGMPEITLKYGLSDFIPSNPAAIMNRSENTIIALVMKLITEEKREYTSAKYLSGHLAALGFPKTRQGLLPYINLMKELAILKETGNPHKPYAIMKSKEEILSLIGSFLPHLPADADSKQLSDHYLHGDKPGRRYAGDGV